MGTWFWEHGKEPPGVKTRRPRPDWWGTPYSYFRLSEPTCPANFFRRMRLVLNIDFCGDLAGQTKSFHESCPLYRQYSCAEFVAARPADAYFMYEAYWNITRLDVYQK